MTAPLPHEVSALLKRLATEASFDLAGISRAEPSQYAEEYRRWIETGRHGSMEYLARNIEERVDLTRKFPWAKSVLSVALAYHQEVSAQTSTDTDRVGKIAKYAWGRDYHKVLENKLKRVEKELRLALPGIEMTARSYVDTGPILEREFAARAGVGWIGKHTLLIHPQKGSFFLLGELITSLDAEPDSPMPDHCGTCTRCIQACPTDAITPYSVDGTKCISYLTLEHRGEIAPAFHDAMQEAGFVAGCDICQDVCPFNRRPLVTSEADFAARSPAPSFSLQEILRWQEQDWDILTRGRAFRRAKFPMWQRNAKIAAGETAD